MRTVADAGLPHARSFVAGEWRRGEEHPDVNPSHPSQPVATVHLVGPDLALEAIGSARDAAGRWRRTPAPARGEILRRGADLLESRSTAIGRELAAEEGKTLAEAIGETRRAVAILRYFAGQTTEPDGETFPSHSSGTFLYARREPIGVVLAITPWNFPIAIPAWKIAPALAYGNAVVWKPAEYVPLTAVRFVEALTEAGLPPGTLNLVLGKGSTVGDALISGGIDAVTFTGSNEVGRAVQQRALTHGAKVQLEMGGKNPAVVTKSADLAFAAERVARGAFLSAGQKCTATSRVVVEDAVLQEFSERLVELALTWRVGDALDPETVVGPVVSEDQLRRVLDYLQVGRSEGGQYLAGGSRAQGRGEGYFVQPSVITGLPAQSRLVREEIFGPVATLLPAGSFEEAVEIANDTSYGLSATIFTSDLAQALTFAQKSRAGVVKVNQESAGLEYHVPFGGNRESSSGSREQGKAAREFFTAWKTVYIDIPPTG